MKEGKQLAIITGVIQPQTKGNELVCGLEMAVTRGADAGQRFARWYPCPDGMPSEQMRRELLVLGFAFENMESFAINADELIGRIALISFSKSEGQMHCRIVAYMGMDDPKLL